MICIPLFFIIMGYLNHRYIFNRNYIYRIKPILISYFLAVSLSMIAEVSFTDANFILSWIVSEFFNLNVSNYAWYARMYLMFFLLIPFLNRWFKSLVNQKETQYLLFVLGITCALPAFLNPLFLELGLNISIPAYFVQMYPLLYYFIGVYFYTHPIYIRKSRLALVSFLLIGSQVLIYTLRFSTSIPNVGMFGSYGSLINVLLSVSVFLLLIDIKLENSIFRKLIVFISKNTFDIYLISHIFDRRIYPIYNAAIFTIDERLYYLILPILFTLISSIVYVFFKTKLLKKYNL